MPLNTKTTTTDEATDDLEAQREELADEVAQIHPDERSQDNDEFVRLSNEASEIERQLAGLEWAREEFGGDAMFELGGLTTSEVAEVNDRVADFQATTISPTESAEGAASIFWIAQGMRSAPFFDAQDLTDIDDPFQYKVDQIGGLPKQLTNWLESEINSLSTVGDREGNSFMQLVEAKSETYHETSE
jgi:hypothetical protein